MNVCTQHKKHPTENYCLYCDKILEQIRCERHAGEPYPPRCYDCDALQHEEE